MSSISDSRAQPQQHGEIDLSLVFRQLWDNKKLIFLIVLITLAIGVFSASRKVPLYQAEILLQIKSDQQAGVAAGKLAQRFNFGLGQNSSEATQIALIKSRFILAPVVTALGLDIRVDPEQYFLKKILFPSHAKIKIHQFDVPWEYIKEPFTLVFESKKYFSLYNSKKNILLRGAVGKLAVSTDEKIKLLISSVDAFDNTKFTLNKMSDFKVIAALMRDLRITDLGENRQSTGVLRLTLIDPDPKKAVDILNTIGRTLQAKDLQKKESAVSRSLDSLYEQLPITKEDLSKAESRLNYYRSKNRKIDIKLQSEHLLKELSEIDKQLAVLRIDSIDKLQRYTSAHPLIIGINTRLRELNVERRKLEFQLQKVPPSDQIAMNMLRDVKIKESLYKDLLVRSQQLHLTKAGIVSDVDILSLAKIPNDSLPLKRNLIYVVSLIFGLMLSFMIIFTRKLLFPRVDDPQWSERHCDLTNLAIIPYVKENPSNRRESKENSLSAHPLLSYVSPSNLAIKSLRSLRTTLQIKLRSETNNIVSILGVSPGVGKTFVSANLAYLLATAGKRVVLIDSDMHRGTLHRYYNLQPVPGLSEVLTNKKTLAEVLMTTLHTNLMVISRGTYPADPSELLISECFNVLLSKLSQQFDIVVIDTPPVSLVNDAILVGLHAGTNYLVVGANVHQPSEIENSIKRLSNAGVILDGTIFNFHKQEGIKHNHARKYGYYHDKEKTK